MIFFCHFDFTTWPALCIFAISTCIYNRSVTLKSHNLQIRQGLSYRAQFCPVTVTKMWTTYSQNKKIYYATKKFLTSRAFHPCITLGVKDNRKLVEKIFEVKKSPRNGTFCLPLFLVTQVWAVVMAKFAIGSYLSKLPNVLP